MDEILSIVEISRAEAREDARNNRNLFIGLTGLLLAVIAILSAFGPQMFEAGMHVDERAAAAADVASGVNDSDQPN